VDFQKKDYRWLISKEVFEQSKYPEIAAPIMNYRGDRFGLDLTFQMSCIDKPVIMDQEPLTDEFDRYLFLVGSNTDDVTDFQAQVELPLGPKMQKHAITQPTFVYLPQGLAHGPLSFENIRRPVCLYDIQIAPKYSVPWDGSTDYAKYIGQPHLEQHRTRVSAVMGDGMEWRYKKMSRDGWFAFSRPMGFAGKLCWGYYVYKTPFDAWETLHYHETIDEWICYLGGNPLDATDFDADIYMWWGKGKDKISIDSSCVVHIPAGLPHYNNNHERVGKPFVEIIATIAPKTGDYFSEGDRVNLSKEEDGDVLDPPNASYTGGMERLGEAKG